MALRVEVAKMGRPNVAVTLRKGATVEDALTAALGDADLMDSEKLEIISRDETDGVSADLDDKVSNGDTILITTEGKAGRA